MAAEVKLTDDELVQLMENKVPSVPERVEVQIMLAYREQEDSEHQR